MRIMNCPKVLARGRRGPMAVRAAFPSMYAGTCRTVYLWSAKLELYAGGGPMPWSGLVACCPGVALLYFGDFCSLMEQETPA